MTTEDVLLSDDNTIHPDMYVDALPALLEVKQVAATVAA